MSKLIFTLCLAAISSVTFTTANEWKYGCLNTTAYKGDNTAISPAEFGGNTFTCAQWYTNRVGNGQNLNGVTFNASLTCSKLPSADAKSELNVLAKYCCTGSTSICSGDPKYMCKDAGAFTPTKTVNPTTDNPDTCINLALKSSLANMPFEDIAPWSSATKCSDFATTAKSNNPTKVSAKAQLSAIGSLCCSDGKTACNVDYSRICKDPSTYTGTKETSEFGSAMACNKLVEIKSATSTNPLFGTNWSTVASCSDVVNTITEDGMTGQDWAKIFAGECCSDKIGICQEADKLDSESEGIMFRVLPKEVFLAVLLATSYLSLL